MKKLKMTTTTMTFEEGCNKYLENCRQRNLREGTIGHYKQSYTQFYKYFDPKMPIEDIDATTYKNYVLHLKSTLDNDVSINSYLRDLITTVHFWMDEGYLHHFKMQAIKVDKSHIETYNESELQLLLKKPNIKKCSFTEYQCWVITNFLFSTGVRQRSLMHIQIKDVDFDNNVVYVMIPIRIIITQDENLKNSITKATNNQTSIKKEQLEALSTFQKKLEEYYKTYTEPEQVLYYERRSGQYRDSGIVKSRIVTIPMQIKTVTAMFLNNPHGVSGQYGTIAKNVGNKIFKSAVRNLFQYSPINAFMCIGRKSNNLFHN